MKEKSVIAIGNFDGFHLGHKKIINELFHIGNRENLLPVLVTFSPNPKVYFKKETQLIFTDRQKKDYLLSVGLDNFIFMDFNKVSQIHGETFIKKNLIENLKMAHLVVGYNFKFGNGRDCGINSLKKLSMELNFELTVIAPILLKNKKISSTLIRSKIKEGLMEDVAEFLGHRFYIDGVVFEGYGRGKNLGFPTINIETENNLLPMGVFNTIVQVGDKKYNALTNIGINPTFNNNDKKQKIKVETHILDFNKSLYGNSVRIFFQKKIRDEKKFKSEKELINQIRQDVRNFNHSDNDR